jgi:two-component system, NarL family, response regulator NreC
MINSYNILLVDDHVHIRRELKVFLDSENGLKVIGEAGDGIELLDLLSQLSSHGSPMADLVILDISMPRLGGIETSRQLKQAYPSLKILFLSSYDNREYYEYAINGGAHGYLLKDDMDTELLSAINATQRGDFYLSAGLRKGVTDQHPLSQKP